MEENFNYGSVLLKKMLHELYPKTMYYRILHVERGLSPTEQERIATLFTRAGVAETPVFDRYTEEYDWEERHVPKPKCTP